MRSTTPAPAPKGQEFRREDFLKMDSLHFLASENGLRVMSFTEPVDGVYVEYLKPSLAREPKLEECRDEQDYNIRVATWIRSCTVRSRTYPSFKDMVLGEIERLKKLL